MRRKIRWPKQRPGHCNAAAGEVDAAAIEAKVQFKFIILTIIFYYEFSLFKKEKFKRIKAKTSQRSSQSSNARLVYSSPGRVGTHIL